MNVESHMQILMQSLKEAIEIIEVLQNFVKTGLCIKCKNSYECMVDSTLSLESCATTAHQVSLVSDVCPKIIMKEDLAATLKRVSLITGDSTASLTSSIPDIYYKPPTIVPFIKQMRKPTIEDSINIERDHEAPFTIDPRQWSNVEQWQHIAFYERLGRNMNMVMPLRWGIVGAGMMSHDFVLALSSLSPFDHQVVAIAASHRDRAENFATHYNIKKVHGSYEKLAKNENIDIVYIGVLNPQHFALSKLMLENGKHVLCEKPLCMNYKETKALVDIAKLQNLFLMEGVWSRCFPAYESLDRHIQSGNLGDIFQVNVQFGVPISEEDRLSMKELGGGTVLDLGVYVLQFAQLIYKEEPLKIVCAGHLNSDGIDESMSCVLTYSNGRTATLTTHSKVTLSNEAVIIGSNGTIKTQFTQNSLVVGGLSTSDVRLTLDLPYSYLKLKTFWAPTIFQASPADITEWELPNLPQQFNFHNSAGLSYEAEECRKCIAAGLLESPKMSHEESLLLAKLEDELRKQLGVVFQQD